MLLQPRLLCCRFSLGIGGVEACVQAFANNPLTHASLATTVPPARPTDRLPADLHTSTCRLAFYGRLCALVDPSGAWAGGTWCLEHICSGLSYLSCLPLQPNPRTHGFLPCCMHLPHAPRRPAAAAPPAACVQAQAAGRGGGASGGGRLHRCVQVGAVMHLMGVGCSVAHGSWYANLQQRLPRPTLLSHPRCHCRCRGMFQKETDLRLFTGAVEASAAMHAASVCASQHCATTVPAGTTARCCTAYSLPHTSPQQACASQRHPAGRRAESRAALARVASSRPTFQAAHRGRSRGHRRRGCCCASSAFCLMPTSGAWRSDA